MFRVYQEKERRFVLEMYIPKAQDQCSWVLVTSDDHFDSKECDRAFLKRIHEEAKKRNAPILKFGDTFDAMGGKWDERTLSADLRPEYQGAGAYFTSILEDATKFYSKYPIVFVSPGNHEEKVYRKHQIDLAKGLANNIGAQYGPWDGWIRIKPLNKLGAPTKYNSIILRYTHGFGGAAPRTGNVGKSWETQASFPLCDVYFSGHKHKQWLFPIGYELYDSDVPRVSYHCALGTSKRRDNYFASKGYGYPILGWWWLKIFYNRRRERIEVVPHLAV